MEQFIVSARKYRPATFETVVGQESITTTLRNTIRTGHLAQAYLFCGPRGVGKTTCARIFAKTINCTNLSPDTEPCNQCESCRGFIDSRSFNIHELDAASNNSVEDIRTLIDQVRIPPQIGKYSVYIIDEVHMLSAAAFNAFLKTLEEPPKHAVFILATTEKHKILPTILSRCQIFDFNRIKVADTVAFLSQIAKKEEIEAETDALNIIAQKADGAMRDALSIFDQIVSFTGGHITYKKVIENLNILDYDYYFRLTDVFLQGNVAEALLLFNDILDKGFDSHHFLTGLAGHFRDLLVARMPQTISLLEVGEGIKTKYLEQSRICTEDFLMDTLSICNQADIHYKSSRNQRLLMELTLLRLCLINADKKKITDPSFDSPEFIEKQISEAFNTSSVGHPVKQMHSSSTSAVHGNEKVGSSLSSQLSATLEGTGKTPVAESGSPNPMKIPVNIPSVKDVLKGKKPVDPEANPEKLQQSVVKEPGEDIKRDPVAEIPEDLALSFTLDELMESFKKYVFQLKNNRPRMYSTLIGKELIVKEDFQVEISMDNTAQLDDFSKSFKQELQNWLRRELKNNVLQLNAIVNEGPGQKNFYTAEDRFRYMAQKNPLLEKMRQQFNLDFE